MKKSLVALAALAVVGAASAQSTVTMYGLVDMGIATLKDSNSLGQANVDTVKNGVQQGTMSNSRIGFKGTEDLGGGLKANFVLEYAVNPDEKTTTMDNRLGTVGLSGNFGALTVGRQYTPYHNVQAAMDLLGNLNATPGYVVNAHNFNGGRASNSVNYTSPTFSGFTGALQVSAGPTASGTESANVAGKSADGKGYGLSGIYAAGPLVAGVAYNSITAPTSQVAGIAGITGGANLVGFGTTAAVAAGVSAAGAATAAVAATDVSTEVKVWAAGASYDFNVVKASLAYSALTDTKLVGPEVTSKGYNFSIAAPFGATTVAANLGRATVKKDAGIDATTTGYQLLASYALSKRTNAYATYGSDKTTAAGVTGEVKRTSTAVGIRHAF